ncbi:MAG: metal ABC transporter substrate-binding protein [bacterium]|nr:metal ABC transporter substrate-binding protein [bacterium]
MKRMIIAVVATAALCMGLIVGCSGTSQSSQSDSNDSSQEKINVVCATFPAYDWTREIVGDRSDAFEITYLMGSGVDLHSYQPTVEDVAKISDADLFIYVGGESDEWAEDAVEEAANPDLHVVSMLDAVGDAAVEEEIVEGMEAEEHEHGEADHEDEGEEGPEYDEHVWLSLRNAQVLVDAITAEISDIDPEHAGVYKENAEVYKADLAELDSRYANVVAAGAHDTIVFADRFPFRYLVDDYGLKYYAAFVGCSAESEASFETVAFLAQKVDELNLGCVLVIESSDQKIAQTVVNTTQGHDQEILTMDSLQSATDADIAEGKTYLETMENNLSILSKALK